MTSTPHEGTTDDDNNSSWWHPIITPSDDVHNMAPNTDNDSTPEDTTIATSLKFFDHTEAASPDDDFFSTIKHITNHTIRPKDPFIPTPVISVLVLAFLCAVMGLVYAYIYFTRISSRQKKKSRKPPSKIEAHLKDRHGGHDEEKLSSMIGGPTAHSTHMFLFKKSAHHNNVIL